MNRTLSAQLGTARADRSEDRRRRAGSSRPPGTVCWSNFRARSSLSLVRYPRSSRGNACVTGGGRKPARFRIGVNVGDIISEAGDILVMASKSPRGWRAV